jgi:hypothetical protein
VARRGGSGTYVQWASSTRANQFDAWTSRAS